MSMPPGGARQPVPYEVGQVIHANARDALGAGGRTFTCSVLVGSTRATGRRNEPQTYVEYDAGPLIDAVEALGWHLVSIDHVWSPSDAGAAELGAWSQTLPKGLVRAYLLFRRA